MKPPAFWYNPPNSPGILANLLAPVGWLFSHATARRVASGQGLRADVPIICVGNINAGGTGKTPTVIALCQHLNEAGMDVQIVTRGYGGSLEGPIRVDEKTHNTNQVGDEPLLLSAFAPTWVSKDRATGVIAAQDDGAQVIILDDGFQNPSVQKDVSIVVVDADKGFGNGRAIPAGPLRETVSAGLRRADIVLTIGEERAQEKFRGIWGSKFAVPQVIAELNPLPTGMDWQGLDVVAFAGIGHPEKFFRTLNTLGANLVVSEALDDHQPLTDTLMARLEADAKSKNAQLVTTEKDAVRLPKSFRAKVLTVPVRLEIKDWSAIDKALTEAGLKLS